MVGARDPDDAREAKRLIVSGALTMVVAALACGAVLAASSEGGAAFLLAAAIAVLALLRTGRGIARLRDARLRRARPASRGPARGDARRR